jgi:hypothetical protein
VDLSLVMQAILPASMHGANKHSWTSAICEAPKALSHWKPGGTAPGMGAAAAKALKALFNWLVNPPLIAGESRFQRCHLFG